MSVSVNQFRNNLKYCVDSVVDNHEPLIVSRKRGEPFVVLSLEDYNREKETLYVLQSSALMRQIESSLSSYNQSNGYIPTSDELDLHSDI